MRPPKDKCRTVRVSGRIPRRLCLYPRIPDTMPPTFTKPQIVQAVEDLPDDATIEDAIERLHFLRKVQNGLVQSESGETISVSDLEDRLDARRQHQS